MKSMCRNLGKIEIPVMTGHISMVPFDMQTLKGIPEEYKASVENMLRGIKNRKGVAHFTIHGQTLKKSETQRRPGAHTDGNYVKTLLDWGGNGWKVGENGPSVGSTEHARLYETELGGMIIASNFQACNAYLGEFDGLPGVGGDCSKISLGEPSFKLEENNLYYGNNHFIHESLPMSEDVHRVMMRITLPEDHEFEEG